MATRVTQQLLFLGYTTAPEVRCTSLKVEVIRSNATTAITATQSPVVFIIT